MKNLDKAEITYLNTITGISIHFMNIWGTLRKENRTMNQMYNNIAGGPDPFHVFILQIKSDNMAGLSNNLKTKTQRSRESKRKHKNLCTFPQRSGSNQGKNSW